MKIENRWLDVPVAGEAEPMSAYLARPAAPGPHATVLVGFEMFGVTDYVRAVADRIAALGYTAVVPDFYHRSGRRICLPATAEGRSRGLELLSQVTRDGVDRDIQALLDQLPGPHAMVGLSVGGHIAYYSATRFPFAAVAAFYPGWLTDDTIPLGRPTPTLELTAGIAEHGTRLLLLVGDGDHLFTRAQLDEIASRLDADGVDHDLVVYPDTPHGFFCHERDTYRPDAADDAFARVTSMLADHLR
ncbi:dienelactone hydrolase family protein [Kutzneria kofuensis]|uniref:Carboxymethylenebutenolidase n=1 Tax=Kutzneria kofuensis TaxID=103725 RepID=A0A7W9KRN3_9PSEU|nr:dienelactone hydrolase family protein [Kutzneria kofuensis]MBB5897461.1 carboxymethylenebutenolidase [Kutzneria kofuensis]